MNCVSNIGSGEGSARPLGGRPGRSGLGCNWSWLLGWLQFSCSLCWCNCCLLWAWLFGALLDPFLVQSWQKPNASSVTCQWNCTPACQHWETPAYSFCSDFTERLTPPPLFWCLFQMRFRMDSIKWPHLLWGGVEDSQRHLWTVLASRMVYINFYRSPD